jgi:hypothetical protein
VTTALALAILQHTVRYDLGEKASFVYDVQQKFKALDDSEETTTIEIWTFAFAERLAGGAAKLETTKVTTAMVVDGQRLEIRAVPHRGSELRSPRGDVRDREPSNQVEPNFELRLLRIADVEYPAELIVVGKEWRRESKPTNDGLPGATWVWKPTQVKDGRLTGTFSFVEGIEKPIQAEGRFVLSLADGWPIELSFKAANTHQLGDEEKLPTVYSFSMKRR